MMVSRCVFFHMERKQDFQYMYKLEKYLNYKMAI